MSDWFSTAIGMQAEILKAQRAQMDAAQKMLNMGKQVADAQQVSRKAAEANMQAFNAWAKMWGWKG